MRAHNAIAGALWKAGPCLRAKNTKFKRTQSGDGSQVTPAHRSISEQAPQPHPRAY